MSYRYPYGNTEQMNLDWFLNQWEKFKADWAEAEAGIDGSLDAEIAKVEAAMSELYAARDAAAASATAARKSSLDAAAAQVAAGNSKTAAQAAETSARGSQQAAEQSAQEAQASAQGAENSALTASQAANTATQQAAGADAARGAAEAAQQAAEDAQAAAAQSAGQAGQAATAAADHADNASDSATLAQKAAQNMSDSVEQITTNKNDISDLKESISNNAIPIINKASGAVASFSDGGNNTIANKTDVKITPSQSGYGNPALTNIRPISGRTGLTIKRAGKNLIDDANNKTLGNGRVLFYQNNSYLLKAGVTYTFSLFNVTSAPNGIYISRVGGNSIATGFDKTTLSITPTEDVLAYFWAIWNQGQASDVYSNATAMLEVGNGSGAYEAYQGEVYEITFSQDAGTVYGGTLTINEDGSATLISNMGFKSYTWGQLGNQSSRENNYVSRNVSINSASIEPNDKRLAKCNVGVYDESKNGYDHFNIANSRYFVLYLPRDTPEETVIEVSFVTTSSTTYQFTAEQIKTLLGINNIVADSGNITIDYVADTKLYIDNKIAELQATVLENIGG